MKSPKRHLGILICIIVIVVTAYFSANFVMDALVHSNKEIEVPNITGKSLDEALEILAPLNLSLSREGQEINANIAQDSVVRQTPPAGTRVREGKVIKVIVSKNSRPFVTPNVVGKTPSAAIAILNAAGLTMADEVVRRYSVVIGRDIVAAQQPQAGEPTQKGASVVLVVSEGPPPAGIRLMPNLVGKTVDFASSWAQREQIELSIIKENVQGAGNIVIRQEPEPDADITEITAVRVFIPLPQDERVNE
ncbi:MAG: PASTA domain-containing protein [Elusimicrobiota bacterium]|jgi:serine/threonine-protein kinase|nr:PASTA domain-containing protein [Elusimicrobiota bacterium]